MLVRQRSRKLGPFLANLVAFSRLKTNIHEHNQKPSENFGVARKVSRCHISEVKLLAPLHTNGMYFEVSCVLKSCTRIRKWKRGEIRISYLICSMGRFQAPQNYDIRAYPSRIVVWRRTPATHSLS